MKFIYFFFLVYIVRVISLLCVSLFFLLVSDIFFLPILGVWLGRRKRDGVPPTSVPLSQGRAGVGKEGCHNC